MDDGSKFLLGLLLLFFLVGSFVYKDQLKNSNLQCPVTEVVNSSKLKWDRDDERSLAFNKIRCGFKYRNSPCLTYFEKLGERSYKALCGPKR